MPTVLNNLLSSSLLVDLHVYDVADGALQGEDSSPLKSLATDSVAEKKAKLRLPPKPSDASDSGTAENTLGAELAFPIFRGDAIVSVVAFAVAPKSVGASVFELWAPVGPFEEVGLEAGYFAHLERFSNVSSFVRFERGSGLPGQAWSSGLPVIHDDLPNHPGFLRAAGASAGLLKTALGIPVISGEDLQNVVVLISSAASPLAKGYEVWNATSDGFVLEGAAYQSLSPEQQLQPGVKLDLDHGLPGLAAEHGGAITSRNQVFLNAQRDLSTDQSSTDQSSTDQSSSDDPSEPPSEDSEITGGLAIPVFHGDTLASVLTLLF